VIVLEMFIVTCQAAQMLIELNQEQNAAIWILWSTTMVYMNGLWD